MNAAQFHSSRKFAKTKFGRIAYVERGEGPRAALLVHGLPLNGFQWREVLEDLASTRRCIAPDLMGLGYGEIESGTDLSFGGQAKMLTAFLDALGIDSVDLCGNDTGGGVSQVFAATAANRVRTLTLTNCEVADLWPNEMLTGFYAGVKSGEVVQGLKMMLADASIARAQFGSVYESAEMLTPELLEVYLAPVVASDKSIDGFKGLAEWERSRQELVAQAPALRASKIPTQVIWGEADTAFDKAASLAWFKKNLGGLKRTVLVPRAKLFFPEEHPRVISTLLKEFWEQN
jgi:pimeloyl-ACP methyl ester carboxylesterase